MVFIHEFVLPYHERASFRASEWYDIKNLIFLLHITCLKKPSHQVEVQDSIG